MGFFSCNPLSLPSPSCVHAYEFFGADCFPASGVSWPRNPLACLCKKSYLYPLLVFSCVSGAADGRNATEESEKPKFKWVRKGFNFTEEQNQILSQLPSKMSNRCKSLMKQIVCFSSENGSISCMLAAWVKGTNPRRTDWLSVLKQLERLNHPLFFKVLEHALAEESFEANPRDYTKLIHGYAKQNDLHEAEQILLTMKTRGVELDQVTLTALVHMYSKAGNLEMAENSFEEMKLLGVPLDKRSYGSMIMAYIRAGLLDHGENLLREMEEKEVYAGREVYKALLRSYSMAGNSRGAQRIFDAIQLARITPDARMCALLINAFVVSSQAMEARVTFRNMLKAGVEPNDKCVALVLAAYEKESKLKEALGFLVELERESVMLGQETSLLLAKWFRKVGVVEEVDLALREFGSGV